MSQVNVNVDPESGSVTVQQGQQYSREEQTETIEQDADGTTIRRTVQRRVVEEQPGKTHVNINAPADPPEAGGSTNINISGT